MASLRSALAKPATIDLAISAIVGFVAWFWLVDNDAFELMVEYMHAHEDWDLDEIFLAVVGVGILGFIYAIRRHREARNELKKREAAEGDTRWIAHHDVLTRLPNRRFLAEFTDRIDTMSKSEERPSYAVYSIDLNGFKKANDLLGHAGGDELLRKVATRLKSLVSAELIFRLGGDEFLVVVDTANYPNVLELAEEICNAVSKSTRIGGIHAQVGASIGISLFPKDANNLSDVVCYADAAMYSAKSHSGKNIQKFDASMHKILLERAAIETDLRLAIENNDIIPYYQPLVELASGQIWGFEALARWKRPGHGFVSPEQFIELSEDMGLITKLSEQLLIQSCQDAKSWPAEMVLSFNLSSLQLVDNIVGLRIIKSLADSGLHPKRLEIEITESAIVEDFAKTTKLLQGLREAGVKIALDDFGTGYSSLSHLSKIQFDRIKIDRSFINDFESDKKQFHIVKAIIELGRGLDLLTTAEGIENESQLATLKKMGCSCGQGYLFGAAVPASEIPDLLRVGNSKLTEARLSA